MSINTVNYGFDILIFSINTPAFIYKASCMDYERNKNDLNITNKVNNF